MGNNHNSSPWAQNDDEASSNRSRFLSKFFKVNCAEDKINEEAQTIQSNFFRFRH